METCKISDFYEAAVLYTLKLKLINTEQENGRMYFTFEDADSCESIINKLYANDLEINAMGLISSIKTIKSIIFRKK